MPADLIGTFKLSNTVDMQVLRAQVKSGRWMFGLSPTKGCDLIFTHAQLPQLIGLLQKAYRDTSSIMAREAQK